MKMDFKKDTKEIKKKAKELNYSLQQLLEMVAKVSFMAGMSEVYKENEIAKLKKKLSKN